MTNLSANSKMNVTLKEFVAVVVFLFTMSGIYWKLYYDSDKDKIQTESYQHATDKRLEAVEATMKLLSEQVKQLQDADLVRKTREDARSSEGYLKLDKR